MLDYFPEEIGHDILFRLPVKCLVRCTSVSKPWSSIIKDSGFIRAHPKRRHETDESLFLLHGYFPNRRVAIIEVYCLHSDKPAFDEYRRVAFQFDYSLVDPRNGRFRVAGTCDGLVFLADDRPVFEAQTYIIWNPSIRKAVMLPSPDFTYWAHGHVQDSIGFGFDAATNGYKFVRLVTLNKFGYAENPTVAEVYSLTTGSWRSIGSVAPPCQIIGATPHTSFNGNIHWVVLRRSKDAGASCYFILAFDLVSESFREILMPNGTEVGSSRVTVTGDRKHLALLTSYKNKDGSSYVDVWIMKEYWQQESWTKMISLAPQIQSVSVIPMPFCFGRSGREIFLELRESCTEYPFNRNRIFVSLDLVSQKMNNVDIPGGQCYSLDSYEKSLVLLDVNNAISY